MKMPKSGKSASDLFTCDSCKSGADGPKMELVLVDSSQVIRMIHRPERRAKVKKLRDSFKDTCESVYPLRSSEKIVSHHIACLATPYLSAFPGALVYVRRTNEAQTAFIVEQVHFDIATTKHEIKYKEPVRRNPISTTHLTVNNSQYVEGFFAKFIFPVASTLSFAVPPPWGIALSAGFQVLSEIFGSVGGQGTDLATIVSDIMQGTITTAMLDGLNSSKQMYVEGVLSTLKNTGDPSFNNVLLSLTVLTRDDLCTIWHDECISFALLAASCLFLSFRLQYQLSALLASFAQENGDSKKYDRYTGNFRAITDEFQLAVDGWSIELEKNIATLIDSRMDLVKDVEYYDTRVQQCYTAAGPTPVSNCWTIGDDGYTYKDEFKDGDDKTVYIKANHRWTDGACNKDEHLESSEDDVRTDRSKYLHQLGIDQHTKYANHTKTINLWKDGIAKVRAMMAPLQPPAPTIKGWVNQPSGDLTQYKRVQYLVEFVNDKGPSPISAASEFQDIKIGMSPLVQIPVDPTGAATKRFIYRLLVRMNDTKTNRMLVDKIIDNTTVEWLDIDRD
ncbi:hypothetical protein D9757_001151 [Collybiopsis confluens]|uniref:Uncharacterized protein n=1 Tax=Collybiopsis confluens TaxID=2823264 RepID=A0A8H5MG11_9AGAR|nr:hypothetical protein D9757_001151 [Collybiopsis confluens]